MQLGNINLDLSANLVPGSKLPTGSLTNPPQGLFARIISLLTGECIVPENFNSKRGQDISGGQPLLFQAPFVDINGEEGSIPETAGCLEQVGNKGDPDSGSCPGQESTPVVVLKLLANLQEAGAAGILDITCGWSQSDVYRGYLPEKNSAVINGVGNIDPSAKAHPSFVIQTDMIQTDGEMRETHVGTGPGSLDEKFLAEMTQNLRLGTEPASRIDLNASRSASAGPDLLKIAGGGMDAKQAKNGPSTVDERVSETLKGLPPTAPEGIKPRQAYKPLVSQGEISGSWLAEENSVVGRAHVAGHSRGFAPQNGLPFSGSAGGYPDFQVPSKNGVNIQAALHGGHEECFSESEPVQQNTIRSGDAVVNTVLKGGGFTANGTAADRVFSTSTILDFIMRQMSDGAIKTTIVRFKLIPEELGEVTVHLIYKKGVVTAHFHTTNPAAKEAVEGSFSQLKDTLAHNNVRLEDAKAFVSYDGAADPGSRGYGEGFQKGMPNSERHFTDGAFETSLGETEEAPTGEKASLNLLV